MEVIEILFVIAGLGFVIFRLLTKHNLETCVYCRKGGMKVFQCETSEVVEKQCPNCKSTNTFKISVMYEGAPIDVKNISLDTDDQQLNPTTNQ